VALNHTNTGADQRKSWTRTPALTRTTHGPLKSEYSGNYRENRGTMSIENMLLLDRGNCRKTQPLSLVLAPFSPVKPILKNRR
jgi:hypothetical protein